MKAYSRDWGFRLEGSTGRYYKVYITKSWVQAYISQNKAFHLPERGYRVFIDKASWDIADYEPWPRSDEAKASLQSLGDEAKDWLKGSLAAKNPKGRTCVGCGKQIAGARVAGYCNGCGAKNPVSSHTMTFLQAQKLAAKMHKDGQEIINFRRWGTGKKTVFDIYAHDPISNTNYVVRSPEEWADRVKAAAWPTVTE